MRILSGPLLFVAAPSTVLGQPELVFLIHKNRHRIDRGVLQNVVFAGMTRRAIGA